MHFNETTAGLNQRGKIHPDPGPAPASRSIKVLFLDFDGVMITTRAHIALEPRRGGQMTEPDPVALGLIRRLCSHGVRIVVSSTWRLNPTRCLDWLEKHELRHYLHTDWMTPDSSRNEGGIYLGRGRGDEIADWQRLHPEVRSYRILDDDTAMLPAQMPYYVHSDSSNGVSYEAMVNLLAWAGVPGYGPKEAA